MDRIEETLKLSPFFASLSQEEKDELVQKLLSNLDRLAADKKKENPLTLS